MYIYIYIYTYVWEAVSPAKGVISEKEHLGCHFWKKYKKWLVGPEKGRVHVGVILKSLPRGGFILASWSKVVCLRVSYVYVYFKAYFLDSF